MFGILNTCFSLTSLSSPSASRLGACGSCLGCSTFKVVIARSIRCGVKHRPKSAVPDCMLDNKLDNGTVRIVLICLLHVRRSGLLTANL